MCSSKDLVTEPFVRFGITPQAFNDLRVAHDVMNCSQPRQRSCDEMPFFDWEAALLRKVLADNKDNVPLCGLIAAMMQYVHEGVQKERGKVPVPKPTKANTIGMFYTPPPTESQQA